MRYVGSTVTCTLIQKAEKASTSDRVKLLPKPSGSATQPSMLLTAERCDKLQVIPMCRQAGLHCISILGSMLLCFMSFIGTDQLAAAQSTVANQASGDPEALATIRASLNALSGNSSWGSIQAAQLSGTVSIPSKDNPIVLPFAWEDLWKGRKIWYLHKLGAGHAERDLLQSPSSGRMLRREDKVIIPVGHVSTLPPFQIPGATLSVVLGDSHCEVRNAQSSNNGEQDYVRITCHPFNTAGGDESQLWAISRETHMPSSVSVILDDLQRAGAHSIETTKFSHYEIVQGLLVPDVIQVQQSGFVRIVTVKSISFPNPNDLSRTAFEASDKK